VRTPWLFVPVASLYAAAWALWSSREWQGTCVDYVNRLGRCWGGPAHIVWTDTLTVALVVAAVSLAATPALWRMSVGRLY
jgi:hypothetical protein